MEEATSICGFITAPSKSALKRDLLVKQFKAS